MSWIKISDTFSVYSVREDFVQYVDWILYFLSVYWFYFLFAIGLTLLTIVLISIGLRIRDFAKSVERR